MLSRSTWAWMSASAAGRLVGLAALDAHPAVLDHVEAPPAVGPHDVVELGDELPQRLASRRRALTGTPRLEADGDLTGLAGADRGHRPHALGGSGPRVLHLAALDGAAPEVVVDGVGLLLGGPDRDVEPGRVLDGVGPGHAPVPHRSHHLEVGGQGPRGHLEADLVVALAGAAVRDGVGTVAAGHLDQVPDDDRARQRGHQRVAVLVEGVGLEGRRDEVAGELVAAVDHDGVDSPGTQGPGLQSLPVAALTDDRRRR